MYMRVADDGSLTAAKPVAEGLSPEAWQGIVQRCQAVPVRQLAAPGHLCLPKHSHLQSLHQDSCSSCLCSQALLSRWLQSCFA